MDVDKEELEEHVSALEDAIEWCNHNRATARFGDDYVYIQVKRGNRSVLHGATSFLQAVEDVAEGKT